MQVAIEFKAIDRVRRNDLKGLNALKEEYNPKLMLLVCQEKEMRKLENNITILPVNDFISMLWDGKIV